MKKSVKGNSRLHSVIEKISLTEFKRSQITVFVILAIVIVVAGGIVFYVSQTNSADKEFFSQPDIKPQVNNIQGSVVDCISETSKDALELIGIQGGYYQAPAESFDLGWAFIPYYYKTGSLLMPQNKIIEVELGKYVNDNLVNCLKDLTFEGFELQYNNPRTAVSIKSKEVVFQINMPITIIREDKRITLETKDFPLDEKSSLNDMLEIARYITDSHKQNPDMVCISCIADMAKEKDLYVDMMDFEEDTTLVVISNNQTSLPYVYEFLNKYPPTTQEVPVAA